MGESNHSMTRRILYLLLLPAATLGRTTDSGECLDNGCESHYGGDGRCVNVRHGNWSQIGRQYLLGTVDKEGLCQSQHQTEDCCRCLPIRTTTTTTTTTTSTTTTITSTSTTTTTTPPPVCLDVQGSCRAAFNGSGSCIDVRQDDLSDIDIDVDPLDEHCGAGPDQCCECFKMKTEGCILTGNDYWWNDVCLQGGEGIPMPWYECGQYCRDNCPAAKAWVYNPERNGGSCWCKTRLSNIRPRPEKGYYAGKIDCVPNTGTVTMLVGGGFGKDQITSEVLGHPSCPSINLPGQNTAFRTVTSGKISLLCGGYGAKKNCYKLNLATRTWDKHSTMLYNRYYSSIVAIGDRIYVLGGEGSTETKKMEWFTVGGTQWVEGPDIERNGLYHGCAVNINDTHIAVIGGVGGHNHGNKVIVFNILSQKWTFWNNLGHRPWGHKCIITEQGILVSGGWSDDKEITNKTVLIDLATGNNRYVGPLNTPRRMFGLVRQDGIILAVGGDTPDGLTNTIEKWVPETESWVPAKMTLSVARSNYGIIEVPYSDVCL